MNPNTHNNILLSSTKFVAYLKIGLQRIEFIIIPKKKLRILLYFIWPLGIFLAPFCLTLLLLCTNYKYVEPELRSSSCCLDRIIFCFRIWIIKLDWWLSGSPRVPQIWPTPSKPLCLPSVFLWKKQTQIWITSLPLFLCQQTTHTATPSQLSMDGFAWNRAQPNPSNWSRVQPAHHIFSMSANTFGSSPLYAHIGN